MAPDGRTRSTYEGRCYCGAVTVRAAGEPVAAGYCHCESCQRWHAAPVNTWAAWRPDDVTVTRGADEILEYDNGEMGGHARRCVCRRCGAGVMNRTRRGVTVVYASALKGSAFRFAPTMHIYYGERLLDMNDGLPKFATLPVEYGGTGETIAEPEISGPASPAK